MVVVIGLNCLVALMILCGFTLEVMARVVCIKCCECFVCVFVVLFCFVSDLVNEGKKCHDV